MASKDPKKKPAPDSSIYQEGEPDTHPSTGQHQPDIQDERAKSKRNNPPRRDDTNPEEAPGNGNPEEYHDGEPVEEKSPKANL